jgi:hypothetical protein
LVSFNATRLSSFHGLPWDELDNHHNLDATSKHHAITSIDDDFGDRN